MNFNKRVNGSWTDIPHYIHNTSTDTITTLPADVYANDTTATVELKGNMVQSGTPTPTTPIQPQECGDLETTGEHTGQYKIPILIGSTTINKYLGEVRTTRYVRKLVLDGTEDWKKRSYNDAIHTFEFNWGSRIIRGLCSHYATYTAPYIDNIDGIYLSNTNAIIITDLRFTTPTDFKAFLAAQYAAGAPVTIWYVLATPETAVVNEPLRKIGEYADEVSGITIPTIAGANTLSIGTTLQPSEVTVNYKGWHPVADVHERENGQWD